MARGHYSHSYSRSCYDYSWYRARGHYSHSYCRSYYGYSWYRTRGHCEHRAARVAAVAQQGRKGLQQHFLVAAVAQQGHWSWWRL